jgi:hypothetical protein
LGHFGPGYRRDIEAGVREILVFVRPIEECVVITEI